MTTMLVDATNVAMTCVFAMRREPMTAAGVPTGPLVLTINRLARLIADEQPTRLLLCWDGGHSTRRLALDERYKAHRPAHDPELAQYRDESFGLIWRFADLAGLPQAAVAGEEGDDLIAGAWAHLTDDDKIVIVSSDKDFAQLLGPNPAGIETELIRLGSRNGHSRTDTDRWTAERLRTEGLPVDQHPVRCEPWQLPLGMALWGDQVDGVAGVPGIGPVRAVKLLEADGWDLSKVAERLEDLGRADAAQILIDLQLVQLRVGAPKVVSPVFEPTGPECPGWDELLAFVEHYELATTKARLLSGALWRPLARRSDDGRLPRGIVHTV